MGRVQLVCRVAWNSDCAPFDVVGLSTKSAKQLNSALIFHLAGKSSTGLSTKSAKQLNSALIFHLARNFTSCIENWVVFCRARFMRGGNLDHYIQSSIRPGIKGFLSDITIYFRSLIGTGKQFKGNMALKIDIQKVFYTLEWSFLLKVLRQFGFSDIILHSERLFVLVNVEVLSKSITRSKVDGSLSAMLYCRDIEVPTHVLYADDILFFCKGSLINVCCLLDIF
ncbi:unnamed protein product [Trifolium pratense]|uniref:Uncharacterized protein n=1 Tax=Trifolium pratense TaxID=57577 RepID=A0ACB0JL98_TRIPR|nr:unnamed protein product [Trifolium pratense]